MPLSRIFSTLVLLAVSLPAPVVWGAQHTASSTHAAQDGIPVLTKLDTSKFTPGRHQMYFRAGSGSNGQPILVPVIVLKGAKSGQQMTLTAAVHGDELNGIAVIHALLQDMEPDRLSGTILAVPGVNQPGLLGNSRFFIMSGGGGSQADPNRLFPGQLSGGSAAERYIGNIWQNLLKPNTDIAIDIHTQTTGSAYPLFVFADFRNLKAKSIALALMPDLIKNDLGEKGTLETTYQEASIPAVTFEVGGPKQFQNDLVGRAVEGIKNVLRMEGFLAGSVQEPESPPFVGSSYTNVRAEEGGTARLKVKLLDSVEKGQLVAVVLDPFGNERRRYFAPHGGRVLAVSTDPLREPGAMLVRILR